jgi:hypothetical protein
MPEDWVGIGRGSGQATKTERIIKADKSIKSVILEKVYKTRL